MRAESALVSDGDAGHDLFAGVLQKPSPKLIPFVIVVFG
jgi:hypothetical protein